MHSYAADYVGILAALAAPVCSSAAFGQDAGTFDAGNDNRMGLTFSPDGTTAFWVEWNGAWGSPPETDRRIWFATFDGDAWSEPKPAPFSGAHTDDDPFVSPDGKWLYFVSDRADESGEPGGGADIWRYELAGENRLERLAVNSPALEASPVVLRPARFISRRTGRAAPDAATSTARRRQPADSPRRNRSGRRSTVRPASGTSGSLRTRARSCSKHPRATRTSRGPAISITAGGRRPAGRPRR